MTLGNNENAYIISNFRNKLRCQVSLLADDDVETVRGDTSSTDYVYHHFLVEVRFEGHPSVSRLELVLRKDSSTGSVRQDNRGIKKHFDDERSDVSSAVNWDDVINHPKYDWLFNRKPSSRANDVISDDDGTRFNSFKDEKDRQPIRTKQHYDISNYDVNAAKANRDYAAEVNYDANEWNADVTNVEMNSGITSNNGSALIASDDEGKLLRNNGYVLDFRQQLLGPVADV